MISIPHAMVELMGTISVPRATMDVMAHDQPTKYDGGAAGRRTADQIRRWSCWPRSGSPSRWWSRSRTISTAIDPNASVAATRRRLDRVRRSSAAPMRRVLVTARHRARPTACPSAAASASQRLSKSQRSRARSGRLHGRVRRAGPSFRAAQRMIAPPRYGTTWHDGRLVEPHPHGTTPAQRARIWNHALHRTTSARRVFGGVTPSTRSRAAPRARSTTRRRITPAQRAFRTTGLRITAA